VPALANTVVFLDPNLAGQPVKAAHVTQLRTAVNALRTLAGLAPASFTDSTITPGVTPAKAVHVTELRSSANDARTTLGFSAFPFSPPTFVPGGSVISASHLQGLRTCSIVPRRRPSLRDRNKPVVRRRG
jgi:hypothetical protein